MSKTKLKTHKGASKRFKLTGTGKIKRSRASGNHLLTKKTSRRKRALKKAAMVHESNVRNVKKLIPYG
ncbi:MAG: 50S ribosomal protein L35 [Nitrospirae bacterium]|nr:50S ribosomal protein L35 [Nitrospirota bacterium]